MTPTNAAAPTSLRPKAGLGCFAWPLGFALGIVLVLGIGKVILEKARVQRDLVRRGVDAPGTDALRAFGCAPGSTVIDSPSTWTRTDIKGTVQARLLVVCLGTEGASLPSCDDVAKAYVAAAPAAGDFVAYVQVPRRFRVECERAYRADASPVGDVAR